ncbi:4-hydroxy-tetrahydrodipicolinate synthase [Fructilactobacillus myrtifloralis]|uniref:4-hydroxy-tetrahydrodipicolinate synthase n=1 Tax=Fructilactobacillus myrtifloralis TaxID=2940301 RepID=A0ABY5BQK3_9LACO|nr:4-hydroxy-tetrahydrodipicolinate synthase [Fructilactobacillus myrtifloralis]USS84684.1 4-hydroxy-tetrahydrodipicolinate synthase [Fructilactobacillus myrtifloralis]
MTDFTQTDIITALITPFTAEQEINYPALETLTERLLQEGGNGFLIGGTTGETPTLTHDEKLSLYTNFAQFVNGRVPVIAGTGSNNTQATIDFTEEVSHIPGIDAALVVVPYYNKPNQVGMKAHFRAVARATNFPIIIYNIPGRTGVNMDVDTVVELSQEPNIIGIKQCGSMEDFEAIVEQTPDDFLVYTGEDPQSLFAKSVGGNGVVSVASHLYLPAMRQMYDLLDQDLAQAGQLQRELTPKMQGLFLYPSPSAVKFMLTRNGLDVGGCRLPITDLTAVEQSYVLEALGEKE